jgi:RND family efflux transporter MFP subunit
MLLRIALPVVCLLAGLYAFRQLSVPVVKEPEPVPEQKMIRTRVAELHAQDYQVVIDKTGIVGAHNEVTLSAEVTGKVIRISPAFEVGAYFDSGEVLVELDARDYENALAMTEAQYAGAKAAMELADLNYQRQAKLVQRDASSIAELNQASATRDQAASALEAAQTQVEQAQRDLQRTKIVAPFAGRVRQKDIGIGQSVGPGTPLGVAFAVDFAEVRLPISARELKYLSLPELTDDPPVDVELWDAINTDSETIWQAQIVRTEGTLDENSFEVFAIARIDDPFGLKSNQPPLRVGQPVLGSIAGRTLSNVVAIPRTSIRQLDQVYLIDKDSLTISSKTITPIWSDEEVVLIRDPNVADGTLVSTTRIVFAPDGAKVQIIPDQVSAPATVSTEAEAKAVERTN